MEVVMFENMKKEIDRAHKRLDVSIKKELETYDRVIDLETKLNVLQSKYEEAINLTPERMEKRQLQHVRMQCLKIAGDLAKSNVLSGQVDITNFTDNLVDYVMGKSDEDTDAGETDQ